MLDLKACAECNYIDEIYEYSNEFYEMKRVGMGGYMTGIALSIALMVINLPFRIEADRRDEIGIVRNKLHKKVITRAFGDLLFLNDDVKNKNYDIYRLGRRLDRVKFAFLFFSKKCRQDKSEIKKILSEQAFSNENKRRKLERFLNFRIAHKCYFQWAVNEFIGEISPKRVYVSYTYDRFALTTEQICKENKTELICIPHGEINNVELPRRYPGDKVYLLNDRLVEIFNKAYKTEAYLYDYEILKKIYRIENGNYTGRRIVYLMTPFFNVYEQANCIRKIAVYLAEHGEKLYIKQHPLKKYDCLKNLNFIEVETLEEAVSGNLCIGLFTTALIDAVFNDSETVSILKIVGNETLYKKHKDVFEGCGINIVESEEELFKKIEGYLKKMK